MAFGKMAEVKGTIFRVHHCHSAEASFAWNPHAAEFKPGQESPSLGQAAKYEGTYVVWRHRFIYRKVINVDIMEQTCQDGSPRISSFSEQLACIKQHASHSHVLQSFPFAEHSHVSFG